MVQQPVADFVQALGALRAAGRLAAGLNARQEQRRQQSDDRDHDQQLDQRQRGPMRVHDARF